MQTKFTKLTWTRCVEGIWRMSGGCPGPEGVRRVSERCLEVDWKVFGSSLEGFLKVPGRCLVVNFGLTERRA